VAEALDPAKPNVAQMRRVVYVVREWLGENPATGAKYLPHSRLSHRGGTGKVYGLHDVLVDADLFRRLRLRGQSRGPAGIPDLETALEFVIGEPFGERGGRRGGNGYSWLAESPLDHLWTGAIVDVAHVVATAALAAGDPSRARRAAETSLRAGAHDDQALLDLVAVADAEGNRGEAQRYVDRILANHDAEVQEDLPPRTYEILRRRNWLHQAS
jgi:hypothetical protein